MIRGWTETSFILMLPSLLPSLSTSATHSQAGRDKQRRIMTANEEHARKLEMEYKEMKCEADRAQAKKEV